MIVCPWKDLGRYAPVIPGLEEAMEAVAAIESYEPRTIQLSGGNKILVQQGTTKPVDGQLLEAHREYLDIQYTISGSETVGWAPLETLTLSGKQHIRRPQEPEILVGFSDKPCSFAIFIETGWKSDKNLEQQNG